MCHDLKYFGRRIEVFMKKVKNTCAWNYTDQDRPGLDRHALSADPGLAPAK
jgi:hypothetical protein